MSDPRTLFNQVFAGGLAHAVRLAWMDETPKARFAARIAMFAALKALLDDGTLARPVESLARLIRRNTEDLFVRPNRMAAPDVRARGAAISEERLGAGADRVIEIVSLIAEIEPARASDFFAMQTAACVSALARLQRDLKLNTVELKSVIKCEAAAIERLYPKLTAQLWRAVIEERDRHRWRRKLAAIGRRWLVSDIEKPAAPPAAPAPARAPLSLSRPVPLARSGEEPRSVTIAPAPSAALCPQRAKAAAPLTIYAPLAEGPSIRAPRSVFAFNERIAAPDFVAAMRASRETPEPAPPSPVPETANLRAAPPRAAARPAFRPFAALAAMRPRASVTAYF